MIAWDAHQQPAHHGASVQIEQRAERIFHGQFTRLPRTQDRLLVGQRVPIPDWARCFHRVHPVYAGSEVFSRTKKILSHRDTENTENPGLVFSVSRWLILRVAARRPASRRPSTAILAPSSPAYGSTCRPMP